MDHLEESFIMRTLYVRIIMTTMGIMIASAVIAFVAANIYYHHFLKPENDKKVTEIAQNTVHIIEGKKYEQLDDYLSALTALGYQFHVIDRAGNEQHYGEVFKSYELSPDDIQQVLDGQKYHGVANYPWSPFITGFFNNELKNTIGVPVQINGETKALFVRPNANVQFGEMRFFFALLISLALLFSFLFILIGTTFIVKPIQKLTIATQKIAGGNYHIKLNVNRRDEIGRLAKDFTKMSDRLEQTEEKRQEFVSNVSHEIQSPLTSIQGFSQALQEEDLPASMRQHYLSIIEKESKRLSMLSKQLLTLSTLEDEVDQKDFVSFNVVDQLKEVIAMTEWQWRKKDLAIEMNVRPLKVVGDPKLLHQVWMNLITNAIRYTEKRGCITIYTATSQNYAQISIADNGIGIPESQLSQIFERFYKVDKARTRTEHSTGLGLAITKKIIERHDGTIMVDSEVHRGTTFHVYLPMESSYI